MHADVRRVVHLLQLLRVAKYVISGVQPLPHVVLPDVVKFRLGLRV